MNLPSDTVAIRRHLKYGSTGPNYGAMVSGFEYVPQFLSELEQRELLKAAAGVPLAQAQYKQFSAKRRVAHFGGSYDFSNNELLEAAPIPEALKPLRARVAAMARVAPEDFTHAMIAEYQPGVQLGWHRDVPDFELVAGVSLSSTARLQFRPYPPTDIPRRHYFNATLEPGSLYLLRGPARWEWQHRVPPVPALRYSITFRTLRR